MLNLYLQTFVVIISLKLIMHIYPVYIFNMKKLILNVIEATLINSKFKEDGLIQHTSNWNMILIGQYIFC